MIGEGKLGDWGIRATKRHVRVVSHAGSHILFVLSHSETEQTLYDVRLPRPAPRNIWAASITPDMDQPQLLHKLLQVTRGGH